MKLFNLIRVAFKLRYLNFRALLGLFFCFLTVSMSLAKPIIIDDYKILRDLSCKIDELCAEKKVLPFSALEMQMKSREFLLELAKGHRNEARGYIKRICPEIFK